MCLIADNNPLSSGGAAGCSDDGAVSSTVATGRDFISTEVSGSGCAGADWTGAAWTGACTAAGGIGRGLAGRRRKRSLWRRLRRGLRPKVGGARRQRACGVGCRHVGRARRRRGRRRSICIDIGQRGPHAGFDQFLVVRLVRLMSPPRAACCPPPHAAWFRLRWPRSLPICVPAQPWRTSSRRERHYPAAARRAVRRGRGGGWDWLSGYAFGRGALIRRGLNDRRHRPPHLRGQKRAHLWRQIPAQMRDEVAADGRGHGGGHNLHELHEEAREIGTLARHGRPQTVPPIALSKPRLKRRLSGEIESEKVTISRKMSAGRGRPGA